MGRADGCIFDPIIDGEAPGHMVLEESDLVAFLDIRPVFAGHTLVVPRRHIETVAELPAELAGRLWAAAARIAAAQRTAFSAEGTFFGLNDVVSQSVPHVHLHVVPRRRKDGLRGFFWPRGKYGAGEAESAAAAIRAALATGPAGTEAETQAQAQTRHDTQQETQQEANPEANGRDGVTIRPARPGDAGAVAALLAGGAMTVPEDPADVDAYRQAIVAPALQPGSSVLVAEQDGRVVGTCQLILMQHVQHNGGLCAEIESMHVSADQRGRGIGSILLDAAVARARAAGCYRVQLTSNKARPDAHRFYLRHGFEATHEGFKLYL